MPQPMRIITYVAPPGALTPALIALASDALRTIEAVIGEPLWLTEGEAAETTVDSTHSDGTLITAVDYVFKGQPVDLIIQDAAADRRRRLLVADMDSTIIEGESLDGMAAKLGLGEQIAAITARAMAGEIAFEDALRERVAMLRGLDAGVIDAVLAELAIAPGAETLVRTMRGWGAHCVLCSGGFTPFTRAVAERVGFDEDHANRLRIEDGRFAGVVEEPILGREAKLKVLLSGCADRGLTLRDAVVIGDGANDVQMIEVCGAGGGLAAAWRAKPIVAASARVHLRHADMTALLFAQGVARANFAE